MWNPCSEAEGVAWLCVVTVLLQHLIGVTDEGADADAQLLGTGVTFPRDRSSSTGICSVSTERFGGCLTRKAESVSWKTERQALGQLLWVIPLDHITQDARC